VQVYVDYKYDGFQAANFYLDRGYREILYVTLGRRDWSLDRLEGVRAAVKYAGLPSEAVRVFPEGDLATAPISRTDFRKPLQAWICSELGRQSLPRAIIGANDHVALDILEVVKEARADEAGMISILGFDDIPEAGRRGLTSFRPPLLDMGREAARLLGYLLSGKEIRGESIHSRLISQVILRDSAR